MCFIFDHKRNKMRGGAGLRLDPQGRLTAPLGNSDVKFHETFRREIFHEIFREIFREIFLKYFKNFTLFFGQ